MKKICIGGPAAGKLVNSIEPTIKHVIDNVEYTYNREQLHHIGKRTSNKVLTVYVYQGVNIIPAFDDLVYAYHREMVKK